MFYKEKIKTFIVKITQNKMHVVILGQLNSTFNGCVKYFSGYHSSFLSWL